jgi:hypothetical protein
MKKITSFLLMVLASVVAIAQGVTPVTSLDQLSDEKIYTLTSKRATLLYWDKYPNKLCSTNATGIEVTYNPTDVNQHFKILKVEDKYYLFSVGAQKYVTADATAKTAPYSDEPGAELKLVDAPFEDHQWRLSLGENEINCQDKGQFDVGVSIGNWDKSDSGNAYTIAEINLDELNPYQMP